MDTVSLPATVVSFGARLVLAVLLGAAVGINREMVLKPAGLRTHALVSLGAALVTIVGLLLTQGPSRDASAPGRVIQGILAGIGFIGGGVILHLREKGIVRGLTTAASIWIVAAAGIAVGAGLWRAAVVTVVLTLCVLTLGRAADRALHPGADDPDND